MQHYAGITAVAWCWKGTSHPRNRAYEQSLKDPETRFSVETRLVGVT